jgi:hypothetical protein
MSTSAQLVHQHDARRAISGPMARMRCLKKVRRVGGKQQKKIHYFSNRRRNFAKKNYTYGSVAAGTRLDTRKFTRGGNRTTNNRCFVNCLSARANLVIGADYQMTRRATTPVAWSPVKKGRTRVNIQVRGQV